MATLTQELTAIRDAVLGREPTPYDYRGEPWDTTLRGLPSSCMLWQRFVAYDAARTAYDAMHDTHRRWQDELSAINQRLRLANPDTTDVDAFTRDYATGRLTEIALREQQEVYKELRQRRDKADESWQQLWAAYQALLDTTWRVKQEPRQQHTPGTASLRSDKLAELDAERRQFEQPTVGRT
jgi:hypothetical protein